MLTFDRRELVKLLGFGFVSMGASRAFMGTAWAATRSQGSAPAPAPVAPASAVEAPAVQPVAPAVAPTMVGEAPWWLTAPYQVGSTVGGARLVSMTPVHDGVVTVELVQAGKGRFPIHICRRDESLQDTPPPARSLRYDFLLANGGKGDKPTSRAEGEAVLMIADAVRRNEMRREALPLVTMRERWRRLRVTR